MNDFYEYPINKDFNIKALKQIWQSLYARLVNPITDKTKKAEALKNAEKIFEKYTLKMLKRCFPEWGK